ncbi:MAG TPA: type II toxin-antitoxin system VapC family toxin [Longimicrobiales bacterium]|nr:type II toxin-antitoxin system VapC family toxin [Longimicrobiales bacterium]
MIVDTSVIVAIALRERGFEQLVARLGGAEAAAIGTPTLVEAGIVLRAKLGNKMDGLLERMLDELSLQEVPFGEIHWREALEAHRKYGKGRHKANLNFGDCMAYATAKLAGSALLYVGTDFNHTDIQAA